MVFHSTQRLLIVGDNLAYNCTCTDVTLLADHACWVANFDSFILNSCTPDILPPTLANLFNINADTWQQTHKTCPWTSQQV